jgi:hypothetical protein
MPARRTNPQTDALNQILRACFPGEKNGALTKKQLPYSLQGLIRLVHSPDNWESASALRAALIVETQLALRQGIEQALEDKEQLRAWLCVLIYYGGVLYSGSTRVLDDDIPGELNRSDTLCALLAGIGLSAELAQKISAETWFVTRPEIQVLKNRGLALWVERLELRYREVLFSELKTRPRWSHFAPLHLDGAHLLNRAELAGEILAKAISESNSAEKALLLYGLPGSGKTTELTRLYYQPQIEKRFGQNRVWVSGSGNMSLDDWRKQLFTILAGAQGFPVQNWTLELRSILKDTPWFIALDNCSSHEFVWELAKALPGMSLLVFTAHQRATVVAQYPEYARAKIEKLEEQDAWRVYLLSRKQRELLTFMEKEWVTGMVAACNGNLLVLKIAFGLAHTASSRKELLRSLREVQGEDQIAFLLRKFCAESHPDLRERAILLGALPALAWGDLACFESVWQTDATATFEILFELEQAGLVDGMMSENSMVLGWRVHESVCTFFAKWLGARCEEEHTTWRERYRIISKRTAWLEEQMQKMGPVGFWQSLEQEQQIYALWQEQLGMPLACRPALFEFIPRVIGKLSKRWPSDDFFSEKWKVLSGNSYLFSSRRYISGYALAHRFGQGSLPLPYLWAAFSLLASFLGVLGVPGCLLVEVSGHVLSFAGGALTVFILGFFRLLPGSGKWYTDTALYNLLWSAPSEPLAEDE